MLAPPGASVDRAREQLQAVRDMDGQAVAICAADDAETSALADAVLPRPGHMRSVSPLVTPSRWSWWRCTSPSVGDGMLGFDDDPAARSTSGRSSAAPIRSRRWAPREARVPPACDLAINGGTLVLPGGAVVANLGIRHGQVTSIASEPLEGDDTLDATGRIVLPGGIDPHVHFRMSQGSMVTSDDYATGSRSAACGGMTTYIDFAVQPSGGSALAAAQERLAEAQHDSTIDFAFHAALTTATDATLADIEPIVALGVRSSSSS